MNTPVSTTLVLCVGLLLGNAAVAQTPSAAATSSAAPANASAAAAALNAFGGRAGLGLLATDFADRLATDPRTASFFKETQRPQFAAKLADQFCQVLGGGCDYQGASMAASHRDLDIRKQDFNALVEILQQAMDARSIPFADQNRLLAQLAPMHRDVITVP
jgi:hemoglobin